MRAAVITAPGPTATLRVAEVPDPRAGPGEVRVRVRAAGVQPVDTAVAAGWAPPGVTPRYPQAPGNEFAGVVDQVGEGVTGFSVGDEVLGWRMLSCYAELVVAPADQVVAKPAGMPWEVAGGLSGAGQTAYTALRELGVGRGDTVLVHGAAGGVGTVAVQLARLWGATVIGTASEANHEHLRSLGAVPVRYGEGLVERVRAVAPNGVDAALDAAGEDALRASVELVADRNRIGTLVAFGLHEELGVRAIRGQRGAERLAELAELWEKGLLRISVRRTYPLERAADAHGEITSGHGRGKIVLVVGS
ncbi:NADPH:quinone reductase [Streptoalloteichus tenebrarius]|uniref:NADPH:quinone reductase n=1 Tax=Streptoalloteichus tenebrarius (strain ATCC 17920 / DSM 40477 / JCM 4838 / CBS 697.72 / NBRC 16177 / NCIMB 11028 / NRRL B-12390 / A12253. 1 / ISP 5477) TaxID=1933 RepID=A0ABT1I2H1_STRSD|nr:NADP-dependent oxidoreductase [Streptoalloteichus tenebrarius]MCP2261982.1 NADPH:quinone reductase [Streptoalloteichus tenebrarius]BFF01284.1 NADP-dependent oxidoreductase [Streptoalloteichus tenebrarius]